MLSQMFIITKWKHTHTVVDGLKWSGKAVHEAKNPSKFYKWVDSDLITG